MEPQDLGVVRDGYGGTRCRNSMVEAGLSEAENLGGEQGQHLSTTLCYIISMGHFAVPLGTDPERNFI